MKISKIRIKNFFGIKEFEANGNSLELSGKNGAGKSSVLDAIKFALSNRSERDYVLRQGEDDGEILIETDTGLSIHRQRSVNKADRNIIKENKREVPTPESFLRSIFTELQLSPVEFLGMTKQEQNRIILDMIDFQWGLPWIKEQFGEIVPEVNYEQNILGVLFEIQSDEGYYFKRRQEINREAKNKQAFIEEIAAALPPNYDAAKWQKENLGDLYKRIEQIRNRNQEIERAQNIVGQKENRIRKFQADLQIETGAIDRETIATRNSLEKQIAEMENKIKAYRQEIETLEEKRLSKLEIAKKTYEANVAGVEARVKEYEDMAAQKPETFDKLQEEAEQTERMKSHIKDSERMGELEKQVAALRENSAGLTEKIEKARRLPGEILEKSNIPIKGITVDNGVPLINGLPVSNLSDGEKLNLCIDVAVQKPGGLNILLIDGLEKLSTENRDSLYSRLKEKGVQFISTRTDDSQELTVVEL